MLRRSRLRRPLLVLSAAALLLLVGTGCGGDADADLAGPDVPPPADPSGDDASDGPPTEPSGDPEPAEPTPGEPPDDDAGANDGAGADDGPDDGPIRAVWVHLFDDTLKSTASIERLVAEVVDAGADTLIAQVARRHDAYYTSTVLPRTADPQLADGLDVLATLLDVTASTELRVHAWISVAPTWHRSYDDLDHPAGWLPMAHGSRAPVADRWVTRTADGVWTDYLDVALPEVTDHVVAIVEELLADYAVDGVHLDYLRYEADDRGYHPDALARFARETGQTGTPHPTDPVWSDWRRDQTRNLVAEVRAAMDATGTAAELSAPVITWGAPPAGTTLEGTRGHRDALQEWDRWAREGLVDVLYPMNYFRAHDAEQAAWFDGWIAYQARLDAATPTRIAAGVGGWLNRSDAVLEQVRAAMAATGAVGLYSFQQPTDEDRATLLARLADTGWGERADEWSDPGER